MKFIYLYTTTFEQASNTRETTQWPSLKWRVQLAKIGQ